MRIGIDLDNTIIDYRLAFSAAARKYGVEVPEEICSKEKIQAIVRKEPHGEMLWQKIQGQVYSRFISTHAKIYRGVFRFLVHSQMVGNEVYVVSHKTIYGHQDQDQLPIRDIALDFLKSRNLINLDNPLITKIFFESTLDQKIEKILDLKLDFFIDDLYEVIDELSSENSLKKYLFNEKLSPRLKSKQILQTTSWSELDFKINGEWSEQHIAEIVYKLSGKNIRSAKKIKGGRNSSVYKVIQDKPPCLKVKLYPDDISHNRLHSETTACKKINKYRQGLVPPLLATDEALGIGIFEWLEGDPVKNHGLDDIKVCIGFLRDLHKIQSLVAVKDFPNASASCFSGLDAENQLKDRLAQFSYTRCLNQQLDDFLTNSFTPTMETLLANARQNWPSDDTFQDAIEQDKRILSPSDFGFHNAIRNKNGSLCFLDLEYFGWDDPVKLIVDTSFHPGMELSNEELKLWIKEALSLYGQEHLGRLKMLWPIYALIWCLILLNDFKPEFQSKRLSAGAFDANQEKIFKSKQMQKSYILLSKIRSNQFGDLLSRL